MAPAGDGHRAELRLGGAVELHVAACHAGEVDNLRVPPEGDLERRLHAHLGVRLPDVATALAPPGDALAAEHGVREAPLDGERRLERGRNHSGAAVEARRRVELPADAEIAR